MDEIKGKIITKLLMKDDTVLVFIDNEDVGYPYMTSGDCCSESWFSDIIGLQNLLGHKVLEVAAKEEQNDLEGTRQDYDTLYGYTLKTDAGLCDINFRNSSNGYYGGSCDYMGYDSYRSYFNPYRDNDSYREITEDFS